MVKVLDIEQIEPSFSSYEAIASLQRAYVRGYNDGFAGLKPRTEEYNSILEHIEIE